MKFRDLPGFSKLFTDYAEAAGAARGFFPWTPDEAGLRARLSALDPDLPGRQELCAVLESQARRFQCGAATFENIGRFRHPGAVAVIAETPPGLFGGSLGDWLKVFAAAHLAAWLSGQGRPAVPLVWIHSPARRLAPQAGVLTGNGPRRFAFPAAGDLVAGDIDGIFDQFMQALGHEWDDLEAIRTIRSAYRPGTRRAQAWGICISRLLDFCGLVICDPEENDFRAWSGLRSAALDGQRFAANAGLQQEALLTAGYVSGASGYSRKIFDSSGMPERAHGAALIPAAVLVVDESDIFEAACGIAGIRSAGGAGPVVWPCPSVTIAKTRDQKILARYHLEFKNIFNGSEVTINNIINHMNIEAGTMRLDQLVSELEGKFAEVSALAGTDGRLQRRIERSRRRMMHQALKLSAAFSGAVNGRLEAVSRQVKGLCDALAPWGSLQEREFAGVQFLIRHSQFLPEALYRSLDIWRFEHQLIHFE